ncbi:MAG TPA: hypothetical protein ENJ95_12595 [Bacteroidetes bacterium]|nr:hypothetical protein [Bacteroidota bacterium]
MKLKIQKHISLAFLLFPLFVFAQQDNPSWGKKLVGFKIKPSVGLQLWSSYTFGEEIYNENTDRYEAVDDRLNFQIRRTRLGFKGQAYEDLQFNVTASLDVVGRDVLSGTEGGGNNGGSPKFRIWNAFVQWRLLPGSEKLNLVTGYMPPQIGRESITSALRSTSLEKSWSQNYLRRHLVGTGPGRAMGVNIGGLFLGKNGKFNWGYDVGIFNPAFVAYGGNSVGKKYSPLLTGRLAAYIGDPESKKYTTGHKVNYFGKRKGLTLALAAAAQGETDLFSVNKAAGFDFLLNLGKLNFDGEWTYMWREGSRWKIDVLKDFTVASNVGYLRLGYNFNLKNGYVLEPLAMLVKFNGETGADDEADAAAVKSLAGEEQIIDLGFNFYFNPDLKISLHYTLRDGEPGYAGNGATVNNYFSQSGVGAIHRGDWLGLGLVAVF